MPFIHPDFLLHSAAARRLYHDYAAAEPILDYHCHLPVQDLAVNRRFQNLYEIWLEGDHYKWRAMRANGVDERFVTGDASPREKFDAWAATVPMTVRNPLFHWTHLEMVRYFGIEDYLNADTAASVWERANAELATDGLSAHGILNRFQVRALCTTDDPADDLAHHQAIAAAGLATKVFPTYRPDAAMAIANPPSFNAWVKRLAEASGREIGSFAEFLEALDARHLAFHQAGARLSDHGLNAMPGAPATDAEAEAIFASVREGNASSAAEQDAFASYLMLFFGRLDAQRGWAKQVHLGALRSVNSRMLAAAGPNTGFDSIGDWPQMANLAAYLDRLDNTAGLPRMILYNLNPADNYAFATMIGNFQDGSTPGKIQFGSGWWFLDQKEAMEWQINALSNNGLLSRFVGMLTDSRSFLSYPRHEYFRRVLCNLLGAEMERGELPNDPDWIGGIVRNICYRNAQQQFRLPGVD
jgi:glucuronate isomerase